MKFKIKAPTPNSFDVLVPEFPKYTTQLMNLANQNAGGTLPKVVGKMSDLVAAAKPKSLDEWREWYLARHPAAVAAAADRICDMLEKIRSASDTVDRVMVERWVEDLLVAKTFVGFAVQGAVLRALAQRLDVELRPASPTDESRGIDGWLGNTPVQVKPESYRDKPALPEAIPCAIVYYKKAKGHIAVDATAVVTALAARSPQ